MVLLSAVILGCVRIITLPFSIKTWIYTFKTGIGPIRAQWESHVQQLKPYKINCLLHLCLFLTPIVDHLRILESNVLLASDNNLLAYHSRQMAQCSMTAVAAALVASVAITTLQLQYMPTIHWIVPALCTATIIIALLSVYNSFVLHEYLTGFACAGDFRTAFTYQSPTTTQQEGEEERRLPCYKATMKLWGPNDLLELAILLYVATICTYWGMAWRMNLQGSGVRSRNVLIFSLFTSVLVPRKFGTGKVLGRTLSTQPV